MGLFVLIIISVLFLFNNAFSIYFFLDDYFFLNIGKASSIIDIVSFFNPIKTYFYRPIPTEVFYLFINSIHKNIFFAHLFVFVCYFIGLFMLYKSLEILSKNKTLSFIIIFLYSIHFIHVFQLYQLATFIEISLFTSLSISFYCYINKKYIPSLVFFILALLSKETALFYPIILLGLHFFNIWRLKKNTFKIFIIYLLLSFFFYLLYQPSLSYLLRTEPFYQLHLNIKLIANNLLWYTLWSLGFPNFLPDYLTSIFSKPLPQFWNLLDTPEYKMYLYCLITYWSLFIPLTITLSLHYKHLWKKYITLFIFCSFSFFILIATTLPTIHRWMVRLTLPLLFVSIIQAVVIYFAYKKKGVMQFLSLLLVVLYISIQIFAIPIHENSSTYLFHSKIAKNMHKYINQNKKAFTKADTIYFVTTKKSGWGGSQQLRNTLHEDDFIHIYFPNSKKRILFDYKDTIIPKNSYVIDSEDILGK